MTLRPKVLVLFLGLATCGAAAGKAQHIAGLGTLDFPTSSRSAPAQAAFAQGMLLLHLFEYPAAAQAFQRAESLDPDFALAYWGEAMTATHPVWNQQSVEAGRAALAKLGADPASRAAKAPTAREKAWLASAEVLYGDGRKAERDRRFEQAMEKLAADYPGDDEAKLFQSLGLLGLSQGERDVGNFLRAAEIAKEVYRRNPDHPGAAHYWIHGMDDPEHAAGAREAANALSKIAPDAGHGQHMTAHIFMALGMWDAVVAANEKAERVVAQQMRSKGQPPYSCGHYAEWLQYGYFQLGRERDGYQVLLDCKREGQVVLDWMRAHPQQAIGPMRSPAELKARLDGSLLSMRAVAIVETARYRQQAAAVDVDTSDVGRSRGWAIFSTGLAHAWSGDAGAAAGDLAALQGVIAQPADADEDAHTLAYLRLMMQMLQAVLDERAGKLDQALQMLAEASAAYDAIPFDFGPPVPVKPPRELRGELLLKHQRPAEALVEFDRALKSAPERALSLRGRAQALAALGEGGRRR